MQYHPLHIRDTGPDMTDLGLAQVLALVLALALTSSWSGACRAVC